jgi:hypothetical protein
VEGSNNESISSKAREDLEMQSADILLFPIENPYSDNIFTTPMRFSSEICIV